MSAYSIGSDSPRWWWPPAAAGAAGAAAIAAILVLPANSTAPNGTMPQAPPAPAGDLWFSTIDPGVGRQCFAIPARGVASFEDHPRCGQRPVVAPWSGTDVRPGLDPRP
ncbi:hypothetical protein [Nocardioides ganghwensis]|jgi:hypothetical protein|uniref:Uncharacterized protein n=1 Tax=Nocardioides ganghwensis TaxID=252230 RepID=A0A4Q2SDT3_9ACTN|nr:hypothetical protein [Nocardioides ganghwensis]MBD3944728.1 hypothetical protein [Nocardioides ganghwensis]RYC00911.1 hypothetical protein EUA07_12965 [Nocardioides ganghwensis]